MTQDALMQFLIEDCTPEQLLDGLAYHAHRAANEQSQVELAAQAYIANSVRYVNERRPPQGEGLRSFAKRFGVSVAKLRWEVDRMMLADE